MDWLTNWDDLIHGTAVFSAAVPFFLTLILAAKVPPRLWWVVLPIALVASVYWLFGLPRFPPQSSEDAVMAGLLAAAGIIFIERAFATWFPWPARVALRFAAFAALAWSIYPAWLAADGELSRKLLVCFGMASSIVIWSMVVEAANSSGRSGSGPPRLTPAAFIPPTVALAVLLQTGGSIRYGQATGALASALGALCLVLVIRLKRRNTDPALSQAASSGLGQVAALWGMLFVLLGWSGWLFAEIRYGLAGLLFCAPLAAFVMNLIPLLPRKNIFLIMLWDFLASAAVSVPIAAMAWSQYAAEMSEFEGY